MTEPEANEEQTNESIDLLLNNFNKSSDVPPTASQRLVDDNRRVFTSDSTTTSIQPSSSNSTDTNQVVVVVDDKDSNLNDSFQCIDLTKENDELMDQRIRDKPSRRNSSRKTSSESTNTTTHDQHRPVISRHNSQDSDCFVIYHERASRPNGLVMVSNSYPSRKSVRRMTSMQARSTVSSDDTNLTIILDDEQQQQQQAATWPSTSVTSQLIPADSYSSSSSNTTTTTTTTTILSSSDIRRRHLSDHEGSADSPSKRTRSCMNSDSEEINKIARTLSSFVATKKSEQIEKPKFELQCPICWETLEELKSNNKSLMATFCGHVLCNLCLDAHFKANGTTAKNKTITCPTCRTKLTKTKIHNLYV